MRKIKDMNTIIADMIGKNAHFSPLMNAFYCKDFFSLMGPKHQRLIAKIFIKNKILYLITHHNVGYQEMNHDDTKTNIKFLIKLYAKQNPQSAFSEVEGLKIFTKRYEDDPQPLPPPRTQRQNIELALGDFKNSFEDERLFELFERVRGRIKCKKS